MKEIVSCYIRKVTEVVMEISCITLEHLKNESWSRFGIGSGYRVFRQHNGSEKPKRRERARTIKM